MLYTVQTQIPSHAPVNDFSLLNGKIFCGDRLRDVHTLQNSIARYGLLSPIIAMKRAGRLIVVDGRKRLAAIRRLSFDGRLPRSLFKIPYLLVKDMGSIERRTPFLLSNSNLYNALVERFREGETVSALTEHFQISRQCVRDVLTLSRLAPSLRLAFFNRMISFSQARAFAAIPVHANQLACFDRLGPFAEPADILAEMNNDEDMTPQKVAA